MIHRRYQKRQVVVDAIQNDGEWFTIRDWMIDIAGGGFAFRPGTAPPITRNKEDGSLNVYTPHGVVKCAVGDWIIKDVAGDFYPCKAEVFDATYEKLPLEVD